MIKYKQFSVELLYHFTRESQLIRFIFMSLIYIRKVQVKLLSQFKHHHNVFCG